MRTKLFFRTRNDMIYLYTVIVACLAQMTEIFNLFLEGTKVKLSPYIILKDRNNNYTFTPCICFQSNWKDKR